jgi:DNA-binding transcriptional ArsR family regulator
MLTDVFGDAPRVKLLDFLLDHVDFDYTITQLHEFTGVSRPTLYVLTEGLEKDGLVLLTREVGASRFFRINVEHPKVARMLRSGFNETNRDLDAGRIGGAPRGRVARPRGAAPPRASSPPPRQAKKTHESARPRLPA